MSTTKISHICSYIVFFHKVLHEFEVKNSVSSNKRIELSDIQAVSIMSRLSVNSFMFSLVNIYLFKVNNGDTRIMYQICSKLIIRKLR